MNTCTNLLQDRLVTIMKTMTPMYKYKSFFDEYASWEKHILSYKLNWYRSLNLRFEWDETDERPYAVKVFGISVTFGESISTQDLDMKVLNELASEAMKTVLHIQAIQEEVEKQELCKKLLKSLS